MNTLEELRTERWLLPDGVTELLPNEAWRVEILRRQIMDNNYRWGYELVMPPLIEYLDSLLTGTGETLGLQTFQFIDQHNGRSLGVRADMTPQVARIDAHAMRRDVPNRLFYLGSVLRARTDGAGSSRTPIQIGAELFGHGGPESDAEIIQLMLHNVMLSGVAEQELLLDIGHVGVFRGLISDLGIDETLSEALFRVLRRGSIPEMRDLLVSSDMPEQTGRCFEELALLAGKADDVIPRARELLSVAGRSTLAALENLQAVIESVSMVHPELRLHVDLAELHGYRYHTGAVFALFDDAGNEMARGGRYDAIGESFGRARPATGFSADLVQLALANRFARQETPASRGIWVPSQQPGKELWQRIGELRMAGERVVTSLADSTMTARDCQCDRQLVHRDDRWQVESIPLPSDSLQSMS